ncbi:WYL domain-containing protein [Planomonospora sp. ID67723]|uniref:helix-turn-helix transcriptional regulator n=1 Tax=Planomonospora sp. ID67723 TaxID=2738134 RepID=UPI0018C3EDBC|nr:WYL domain-containing protein [Planomonospora sp. ID67723]MBG0830345.1 WYL domain-containing protein [Planomonospora sp. ID67723]
MLDTSARLLRLLSLLQTPRDWSGPQLAERLGVTTRTIRNDVERLRALGYPVHATPGAAGGYRLGAGAAMPPLLLDDEEAVAVAVGLRTAAGGSVTGIEETSLRALAKLEQVLPSRLRHRVGALHSHMVPISGTGPTVAADVLTAIAGASRDRERLRFDYTGHDGASGPREAEPHRLVHARGRWYLAAWDVARDDWRTFRVDRMRLRTPNGPRFAPREPPEGGFAAHVARGLETAVWKYVARVTVHAPAEEIAPRLPPSVTVEPVGERTCVITTGSDTPHMLALYLGMLEVDFEVAEPPELVEHVRALAARYARAVGGTSG